MPLVNYKFKDDKGKERVRTLNDDHETFHFLYPVKLPDELPKFDIEKLKELYGKRVMFHCHYFDGEICGEVDELTEATESGFGTGVGGYDVGDIRAIAWRKDGRELDFGEGNYAIAIPDIMDL